MDKAVDLAPDNVSVPLVRGIKGMNLPLMSVDCLSPQRFQIVLMNDPRFVISILTFKRTIYCWAGIAYKNDSQPARAKECYRKQSRRTRIPKCPEKLKVN